MRKIIIPFCIILSLFSLVSCKKNSTHDNTNINTQKTAIFSDEDINAAITCVESNFNFPSCTLKKVWYDEDLYNSSIKEKSSAAIDEYLKSGNNSENIIVLLSEFYVDSSGDNPVLSADSTYSDYRWILTRNDKTSKWEIKDFGY